MNPKGRKLINLLAPVSLGELIDKITILEIKKDHMTGIKLKNVNRELELLRFILKDKKIEIDNELFFKLKSVNKRLWDIEDKIRIKEQRKEFDKEFIEIARSVYKENDIRSSIKKDINNKSNSELTEEKSYEYF